MQQKKEKKKAGVSVGWDEMRWDASTCQTMQAIELKIKSIAILSLESGDRWILIGKFVPIHSFSLFLIIFMMVKFFYK